MVADNGEDMLEKDQDIEPEMMKAEGERGSENLASREKRQRGGVV